MRQSVIGSGMRFDLDASDEVTIIVRDGSSGKTLTWKARTPEGIRLESAKGGPEQVLMSIGFVAESIKIEESA